ncbi:hypothetical protein NKH77_03360 [Streptomyces sp. M19]
MIAFAMMHYVLGHTIEEQAQAEPAIAETWEASAKPCSSRATSPTPGLWAPCSTPRRKSASTAALSCSWTASATRSRGRGSGRAVRRRPGPAGARRAIRPGPGRRPDTRKVR